MTYPTSTFVARSVSAKRVAFLSSHATSHRALAANSFNFTEAADSRIRTRPSTAIPSPSIGRFATSRAMAQTDMAVCARTVELAGALACDGASCFTTRSICAVVTFIKAQKFMTTALKFRSRTRASMSRSKTSKTRSRAPASKRSCITSLGSRVINASADAARSRAAKLLEVSLMVSIWFGRVESNCVMLRGTPVAARARAPTPMSRAHSLPPKCASAVRVVCQGGAFSS